MKFCLASNYRTISAVSTVLTMFVISCTRYIMRSQKRARAQLSTVDRNFAFEIINILFLRSKVLYFKILLKYIPEKY